MFAHVESRLFFPTPIVTARLTEADAAAVNAALEQIVLEKEKQDVGVKISNRGGWQSDAKILEWGGEPIKKLVDEISELLNQITLHLENNAYQRVNIHWRVYGWANVNRNGHMNVVHTHPGAYWSVVYYIKVPKKETDMPAGGELELLDPRGTLPIMYCPVLRFGIKGTTSAGTSELHYPRAGEFIVFPSWLPHAVCPYIGDEPRISIAFNFSI